MKNQPITVRVVSALYRGLSGTPSEIAADLGLSSAQVSRALRALLPTNPEIRREKEGRTFRYTWRVSRAAAKPKRKASTPRTRARRVNRREPIGMDIEPGWIAWSHC